MTIATFRRDIIPEVEIQKRLARKANMTTTKGGADCSKATAHTVTWQDIPEWQSDNKYILSGYRRETADYLEILGSLCFLHNETCNVYTHLVGALVLPLVTVVLLRHTGEPQFLNVNVSSLDYCIFGIYLLCSETCLVLSTLYHLLQPHSHRVEQFWHGMDLLGIVIATVGTISSGIYYIFICQALLQILHWKIILTAGTITGVFILHPSFKARRFRNVKAGVFVIFGSLSLIPLLHGMQQYGLQYMMEYSGMRWYLVELALYGAGAILYVLRFPERLAPGTFDIWGSSHQIFHVAILCAMYAHLAAMMQGFASFHTLDVCRFHHGANPRI